MESGCVSAEREVIRKRPDFAAGYLEKEEKRDDGISGSDFGLQGAFVPHADTQTRQRNEIAAAGTGVEYAGNGSGLKKRCAGLV